MSITEQVKDGAVDVIDGVARLIADTAESRRKEPRYWANFHEVQLQSLPKWRWLARRWHLSRARKYRSHVVALRRTGR